MNQRAGQTATRRVAAALGAWGLWLIALAGGCAEAELGLFPVADGGPDSPAAMPPPGRVIVDPFAGSCAHTTARAQSLPLDLVLMVDISGSMLDRTPAGLTKWDAVKDAFASFFRSASAGTGIGLGFFPRTQPGVPAECGSDGECGAFGPCLRLRGCTGFDRLVQCESDGDCGGGGRRCVLLGECAQAGDLCLPAGESCGPGDPCRALPGRCAAREMCASTDYQQPAVKVAALPGAAPELTRALNSQTPDGSTPTGPALAGALDHAHAYALTRLDRRVAVVLATDGFPTSCDPRDIPRVAALATAAQARSPSVPTFVIGVFSSREAAGASANLDAIARAGGSERAFIVDSDGDLGQGFLRALDDIRAAALACEYQLPQSGRGEIDYGAVNVRVTETNGAVSTIGFVANAAACHPQKGGWYYDVDPASGHKPTLVSTCPATCGWLRNHPRGRVDVVFGCKTVIID